MISFKIQKKKICKVDILTTNLTNKEARAKLYITHQILLSALCKHKYRQGLTTSVPEDQVSSMGLYLSDSVHTQVALYLGKQASVLLGRAAIPRCSRFVKGFGILYFF